MTRFPYAFPILLATACVGAPRQGTGVAIDTLPGGIVRTVSSSPAEPGRWHLVLERKVQPAEDLPGELGDPNDLALADDGTLILVDRKPARIEVFDTAGALVRTIGREGDGPGEYRDPMVAVRGDTLVTQDPRQARGSFFRLSDGAFLGSHRTTCCYYQPIRVDARGRAIAPIMADPDSAHPNRPFLRFPLDGSPGDTARVLLGHGEPKRWNVTVNGQRVFSTPVVLAPQEIQGIDPTGEFLVGWSGEYLIRASRDGADTAALFGRTGTPESLSATEKAAIVDRLIHVGFAESEVAESVLRNAFRISDIPDQRPWFESLAADGSGRRWVRVSTADTAAVHFDLFSSSGRWLDQVSVPEPGWAGNLYTPVSWSRDHLAVLGEDPSGRPLVHIYRIEHNPAG